MGSYIFKGCLGFRSISLGKEFFPLFRDFSKLNLCIFMLEIVIEIH